MFLQWKDSLDQLHIVAVHSKFSVNQVVLQSHWAVVEGREKSCLRTSVAKEFLTTQLDQRDNRVLPDRVALEDQVEIIRLNLDSKGSKAEC